MHRKWLAYVIDVSQISYWRGKLFSATKNEVFQIDSADTTGLASATVRAIRKYHLRYSVSVVDASEAEAWLSECGMVVFKLWANDYPSVRSYSGNNPLVV